MTTDGKTRVLVVEVDGEARARLAEALVTEGYEVACADDGISALGLLLGSPPLAPALIILDLDGGAMPGWEFLAVVSSYSELARTPVLAMSGRPPSLASIARGVVAAWIERPSDPHLLLRRVREHTGKLGSGS
jgi:DNA-binding response OmpR family regulator